MRVFNNLKLMNHNTLKEKIKFKNGLKLKLIKYLKQRKAFGKDTFKQGKLFLKIIGKVNLKC